MCVNSNPTYLSCDMHSHPSKLVHSWNFPTKNILLEFATLLYCLLPCRWCKAGFSFTKKIKVSFCAICTELSTPAAAPTRSYWSKIHIMNISDGNGNAVEILNCCCRVKMRHRCCRYIRVKKGPKDEKSGTFNGVKADFRVKYLTLCNSVLMCL